MMLGTHAPAPPPPFTEARQPSSSSPGRKRKAGPQENDRERLSKRLSLLNIEQNGAKLYVPVETPSAASLAQSTPRTTASSSSSNSTTTIASPASSAGRGLFPQENETMQVDDSKHKVYIYNLDDELSSDSETDERSSSRSGGDADGRLVFLPDIERHLRETRIPRHVLANDEGELAGMQLVLYSDPRSLSVPEDKDGVRRAIIEARQRARDRQRLERLGDTDPIDVDVDVDVNSDDVYHAASGNVGKPFEQPPIDAASPSPSDDAMELD